MLSWHALRTVPTARLAGGRRRAFIEEEVVEVRTLHLAKRTSRGRTTVRAASLALPIDMPSASSIIGRRGQGVDVNTYRRDGVRECQDLPRQRSAQARGALVICKNLGLLRHAGRAVKVPRGQRLIGTEAQPCHLLECLRPI